MFVCVRHGRNERNAHDIHFSKFIHDAASETNGGVESPETRPIGFAMEI